MPRPATDLERTATATDLREQLGIQPASLTRYCRAGLPHDGTGRNRRFHLGEVAKWLAEQNKGGAPGRPTEAASDELQRLRCAKEKLLCKKYELEVGKVEGRLLDIADVVQKYKQLAIEIRERMSELPMRLFNNPACGLSHLEKNLADREILSMCDDVIRQVGAAMAEYSTPFERLTLDNKPLATEPE